MQEIFIWLDSVSLWGNTAAQWFVGIGLFVLTTLLIKMFQMVVVARIEKFAQHTKTTFDDHAVGIIKDISGWFYWVAALYISILYLHTAEWVFNAVQVIFMIALVYESIRAIVSLVTYIMRARLATQAKGVDDENKHKSLVQITRVMMRIVLWMVGLTIILSYLGINVTSIVASLGIGGIAVALALQNILSDIFSSFSIYLDRPFEVGDFIVVGTSQGTVERIGIKTTRLRSLSGEELVVSNKELTTSRIQNFKRMKKRRIAMVLGVTYQTSQAKLEKIPAMLEKIVTSQEDTEWFGAFFKDFGASSLDFEMIYHVRTNDFKEYMLLRERINFEINKQFTKAGISFAYPTQSIYLEK